MLWENLKHWNTETLKTFTAGPISQSVGPHHERNLTIYRDYLVFNQKYLPKNCSYHK